jgi:hypothetical protein
MVETSLATAWRATDSVGLSSVGSGQNPKIRRHCGSLASNPTVRQIHISQLEI